MDETKLEAGDRRPAGPDEGPDCGLESEEFGFVCTRLKGHKGKHAAHALESDEPIFVWDSEEVLP